jgi:hypothetical protein
MKAIILSSLLLQCLLALGDEPAPATKPTAIRSPHVLHELEKARADEIRDLLSAACKTGDPDQASWDAITSKINNYQKEFGVNAATTNYLFMLRQSELFAARGFSDPARYNALVQQLATDPSPAAAKLAKPLSPFTAQVAAQMLDSYFSQTFPDYKSFTLSSLNYGTLDHLGYTKQGWYIDGMQGFNWIGVFTSPHNSNKRILRLQDSGEIDIIKRWD